MKSRKFTQPPIKPQEDEIVESMNIVTLDMVPEDLKAKSAHMHISEPIEINRNVCGTCPECSP